MATKSFACPYCGEYCRGLGNLKRHVRRVHIANGRCPLCGSEFKSYTHLLHHIVWYASRGDREHMVLAGLALRRNGRNQRPMKRYTEVALKVILP
jgi:transcription elongation factor Elf1